LHRPGAVCYAPAALRRLFGAAPDATVIAALCDRRAPPGLNRAAPEDPRAP